MTPESTSTVYNLGTHVLEITQERTLLITTYPSGDTPITELVQLDSDEVYKLFVALKELFQPIVG